MENITLWDGRTYSTEEIARVSPKLLEYAREHPETLECVIDERRFVPMKSFVLPCFTVCFALATFLFLTCLGSWAWNGKPTGLYEVLSAWAFGASIALLFGCIYFLTLWSGKKEFPRTIALNSGAVWLIVKDKAYFAGYIANAAWRSGWLWEDLTLKGPLKVSPCLVLSCLAARFGIRRNLAVLVSGEDREIWEAFLTLARIDRMRPTKKYVYLYAFLGALAAMFGTFVALSMVESVFAFDPAAFNDLKGLLMIIVGFLTVGIGGVMGGSDCFVYFKKLMLIAVLGIGLLGFPLTLAHGRLYFFLRDFCPLLLGLLAFIWVMSHITHRLRSRFFAEIGADDPREGGSPTA